MHRCMGDANCHQPATWYGSVKLYLCVPHALERLAAEPPHQPRLLTTAEELPLGWVGVP